MAKLNDKYEAMVVYSLKNGEEQVEGLKSKFQTLIESSAELISVSEWGKRRLAYPINYENEGYYVLYAFDSKPDFPKELERVLNITEGILRFLTVIRVDAPAKPIPEQSADTSAVDTSAGDTENTSVVEDTSAVDASAGAEVETDDSAEEQEG